MHRKPGQEMANKRWKGDAEGFLGAIFSPIAKLDEDALRLMQQHAEDIRPLYP